MPEAQTMKPIRDRTVGDRRTDRVSAIAATDQIGRTANQVVVPGDGTCVHELITARFVKGLGYEYQARCGSVLLARVGAMRTTRDADCPTCERWYGTTVLVKP